VSAKAVALLFAAASLARAAPAADLVSCRVVDGTALREGGVELALGGAVVRLVDSHAMRTLAEARAGSDGVARFEGVDLSPGHYVFRAERDQIPYFSEQFEVKEGGGPVEGRVETFAASTDRKDLVLAAHHLLFRSHPESDPPVVLVEEFVSVENRGTRTVRAEVGAEGEHGFTYLAKLPPAAGAVRAFLGEIALPIEGGMGTWHLDVPFTAGQRTPLLFEYTLSLTKSHRIPLEPPYPSERLTVIVFDPEHTPVEVEGLSGPTSRTHEGTRLDQYESGGPPDLRRVEIRVEGLSRLGYWATVAAVAMAAMGLAALGTASSRRRARVQARDLLYAIAQLDLAFERGEIPKEEYAPARRDLLARVVAAWPTSGRERGR
jgi:hypothetical protein